MFGPLAFRTLNLTIAFGIFAVAAVAQDIQVQNVNGQLVTGIGVVDEESAAETTLSISVGERVFTQALQPNFLSSNPGFNVEPSSSSVLPDGVAGLGEGTSLFFDFVPSTLDGVTSNVFFWDGTDSNSDGELTFGDIELSSLNTGQTLGIQDVTGIFRPADASDQIVTGGLIETTNVTTQVGAATVVGGRLHEHLILGLVDENNAISSTQQQGLFVASLQVRAEGFTESDPFFLVLHSTLDNGDASPIAALAEEASLLTAFIEDSLVAAPPGDFNFDGVVDAADFVLARDGSTEFDVEEAFGLFSENFDPSVTAAAVAAPVLASAVVVPEPATLSFALLAMTAVGVRRRR